MKEFIEEAITREDRFQKELFLAVIEELQLLRQEIKELKENESKGNHTARRKRTEPNS